MDPTLVNGQITDAVTQANVAVLGTAPAQALATDYQTLAQSVGLGMQNAVASQKNLATIASSVTTQAANLLLTIPVAHGVRSSNEILSDGAAASSASAVRKASALRAALDLLLALVEKGE
jgi:hypothetical protein